MTEKENKPNLTYKEWCAKYNPILNSIRDLVAGSSLTVPNKTRAKIVEASFLEEYNLYCKGENLDDKL